MKKIDLDTLAVISAAASAVVQGTNFAMDPNRIVAAMRNPDPLKELKEWRVQIGQLWDSLEQAMSKVEDDAVRTLDA